MPHEPESLIVTTDTGDRIHYLDWGRPTEETTHPPILLVHGLAATAWAWAGIARTLAERTHVLAMDLRGHGLSDSPRSGYDLESLAFDALTVLTATGYGEDARGGSVAVAGHGLGAMVAAVMAVLRPASVSAVALVDSGWEDVGEATGMSAAEFERSIGDPPEVMASMDAYLADRREFDPGSWDADQERAARAAVDEKHAGHVTPITRAHALRGSVDAMFEYRPLPLLVGVEAPVLFVMAQGGAADEAARERAIALGEIFDARARAGLVSHTVHFSGVGHNVMRYRPQELAAALLALLVTENHHRS